MANPDTGKTIFVKQGVLPGLIVHKGVVYIPVEPTEDEEGNPSHELTKDSDIPDAVFKQAIDEQEAFHKDKFANALPGVWQPPARFRKAQKAEATAAEVEAAPEKAEG